MPNVDVLLPIQTALYTLLDTELSVPVHDHVDEDTPFPYVAIGEATSTPEHAHDRYGARSTVTLHVWSAYHGTAEALGITGELIGLLDLQDLTVTDHHTVSVRWEQTVPMRDPDADLRHVVVRFAVKTEYTAG